MNILLIAGGWSKERDVSLNGARNIETALSNLGHQVVFFDLRKGFSALSGAVAGKDFAFINLHGSPGEDGVVQALLDTMEIPYQGSGPAPSFLALNKDAAKTIFVRSGIPTPPWILLTELPQEDWKPPFGFPIFVKKNTGGSSLEMARIASQKELYPILSELFINGSEFVMEPFCAGMEVTCGVLGNLRKVTDKQTEEPFALPPILIKPAAPGSVFFDYASKYQAGGAEEICPAPLPPELTAKVQAYALKAHLALGLTGYSRTDFILRPDNSLLCLESNTLPGMTATSLIPQEAKAVGLSFEALLQRLIDLGLAARR